MTWQDELKAAIEMDPSLGKMTGEQMIATDVLIAGKSVIPSSISVKTVDSIGHGVVRVDWVRDGEVLVTEISEEVLLVAAREVGKDTFDDAEVQAFLEGAQ